MKEKKKKIGDKGFSLVELIVVIAIMAVLIGVIAPVLIKNIDKSRESTDEQNLDTVRNSIVALLVDETYSEKMLNKTVSVKGNTGIIESTADDVTLTELKNTIGTDTCKLTSKAYKNKKITFSIDGDGKVERTDGPLE